MALFHFGGQYGNPLVSPAYFLTCFVAGLGTFQVIAATYGYLGLAWLPMAWQPWGGNSVGVLLIVGATLWFFAGFGDGIFRPGPAGLELFVIVAGATALALIVTLLGAAVLQARRAPSSPACLDAEPGLSLLRRMTYPQARRWRQLLAGHASRAVLSLDGLLFLVLNGLAVRSAWLSAVVRFLVNDYVVPTALSLLLVALWFSGQTFQERERRQFAVIHAAATVLLANVIVKVANALFFRPRPFAEHNVHLLFYRPTDSTLPSNPAAVAFAFAAAVAVHEPRWGLVMAVLATLFGVARVMAGVHYPLDIVAGALVGAVAAIVALRLPGIRWTARVIIHLSRRLLLA